MMNYKKKILRFEDIKTISFKQPVPTLYEIFWDDVKFEILVNYKSKSHYATVFGSAAIPLVAKQKMPIFNRMSWMGEISCTGIWYSDPTLYLEEKLTLGWGYGTNQRWYLKDIAHLIRCILANLNIQTKDTLFYGSSGGGFMSMALATMLHSKATVINPQFQVNDYLPAAVEALKRAALLPGDQLLEERISIAALMRRERYVPLLHIISNVQSEEDALLQLPSFLKQLSLYDVDCTNKLQVDFYSDDERHNGMPAKADCLRDIEQDVIKECPSLNLWVDGTLSGDKLTVHASSTSELPDVQYEYRLYDQGQKYMFQKCAYSRNSECTFALHEGGSYRVLVLARVKKADNTYLYARQKSKVYTYQPPVEIQTKCELFANKLKVYAVASPVDTNMDYAYYLYSCDKPSALQKQMYINEPTFTFTLTEPGMYFVKVFVRKKSRLGGHTITIRDTKSVPYLS